MPNGQKWLINRYAFRSIDQSVKVHLSIRFLSLSLPPPGKYVLPVTLPSFSPLSTLSSPFMHSVHHSLEVTKGDVVWVRIVSDLLHWPSSQKRQRTATSVGLTLLHRLLHQLVAGLIVVIGSPAMIKLQSQGNNNHNPRASAQTHKRTDVRTNYTQRNTEYKKPALYKKKRKETIKSKNPWMRAPPQEMVTSTQTAAHAQRSAHGRRTTTQM